MRTRHAADAASVITAERIKTALRGFNDSWESINIFHLDAFSCLAIPLKVLESKTQARTNILLIWSFFFFFSCLVLLVQLISSFALGRCSCHAVSITSRPSMFSYNFSSCLVLLVQLVSLFTLSRCSYHAVSSYSYPSHPPNPFSVKSFIMQSIHVLGSPLPSPSLQPPPLTLSCPLVAPIPHVPSLHSLLRHVFFHAIYSPSWSSCLFLAPAASTTDTLLPT